LGVRNEFLRRQQSLTLKRLTVTLIDDNEIAKAKIALASPFSRGGNLLRELRPRRLDLLDLLDFVESRQMRQKRTRDPGGKPEPPIVLEVCRICLNLSTFHEIDYSDPPGWILATRRGGRKFQLYF